MRGPDDAGNPRAGGDRGKEAWGAFTLYLTDWPMSAPVPRLPVGQWNVQVGQGSTGEGTCAMPSGEPDVVFRVKRECQNCGQQ